MNRDWQTLLGMEPQQFLDRYWQKQPLFVANALPDFESPLTADELAGLSLEPEAESRIVIGSTDGGGKENHWQLLPGPFTAETFANLPESHWTLLVQAVDLWVPDVQQLLRHFDFLPRWRLDDIMVSFAPRGGSVGPHWDSYDVFLIQGMGQRRWQIGTFCDSRTPTLPDTGLRILADFEPCETRVLNPGDMLYLPPGISHFGIAENDCMTFSVGFRAPTAAEMLDDLATELLADDRFAELAASNYRDPPLTPAMADGVIRPAFVGQARKLMEQVLADEELLGHWFARYMTRPRNPEMTPEGESARTARLLTGSGNNFRDYCNGDPVQVTPSRRN